MNVDLRHLRALAAIGDEKSVTGAARVLRVSQPALSRTLEQLESRLNVRLVERTTRHVELTDAGRRLWEHAHRILRQLDAALAEAAAPTATVTALRLAFAWAALGRHTVPVLRAWRRHPSVGALIHRVDDPVAALRRGEADLAFLRADPGEADLIGSVRLTSEPRLAALPEGHRLADRAAVRLADLVTETVALCSAAATTSARLWPHDRRPVTVEVPGVDAWLAAIATGAAVGVTAEGTGYHHRHPGVRYVPVSDAAPVPVYLAWPAEPVHASTADFVRLARRCCAPSGTPD